MTGKKKWHTTKEIFIEYIALRFSRSDCRSFEEKRWLSSEAAAQLADQLLSKTGRCIRCGAFGTETNCCNVGKVRGVLWGADE